MRLVTRLKSITEIEKLHQLGVDVFCLDTEFTAKRIAKFSLKEIQEITETYPVKFYLLINKIIHEEDLDSLSFFLKAIQNYKISGIVIADLTVYVVAKKLNLEHLIIYQPGTMNTDTFSEEYFSKRNIKGITISRELTLEEIRHFGNTDIELSLIGHGYLDMFYSKRKLVSNYLIHKNRTELNLKNNYNLRLNEEIREKEYYPIFEDEYGTHIFRSNKLISKNETTYLKPLITDFFIERIFLTDEELIDSIQLYKDQVTLSEFQQKYSNYDSGFYYKRTEKVKGELDES